MTDDLPRRWDDEQEDFEVHRARELDRLSAWGKQQPYRELLDTGQRGGLIPEKSDRQRLSRTETINGMPVADYVAANPDERDQRFVCQACLTKPPKKHRRWVKVGGIEVMVCGACLNAREMYPGHAAHDQQGWLGKHPHVKRVLIIAEFRYDPVTMQPATWHCVHTVLTEDGLHESHDVWQTYTNRPRLYWDLWRDGKLPLRLP